MNTLLLTDSYKVTHFNAYPPGMTDMFSFFESRGGKYSETVFFGLQYFLKKYLETPITQVDVEEAASLYKAHFGMELLNYDGWSYIAQKLGGRLPVRIRAVPEGSVVPTKNVLMTVESTDPKVPWVVNYLEGLLSQVWYPTTVATQSREMKKDILTALHVSGDQTAIDFKLHDFGFRGSTSPESAALGGAAHLVNFQGTDTVPALVMLRDYYESACAGFSIPAAEHSTITSWLRENESQAYRKMLDVNPTGLVAIVADSYDVYNACENLFGGELKDQILSRDGVLVVRPDCYDSETEILTTKGWVRFPELTDDSIVAQYHGNGSMDFVQPSRVVRQYYEGKMCHFYNVNKQIDLLVTPNHRMVQRSKRKVLSVVPAIDTKWYHDKDYIHSGTLQGTRELSPIERIWIAFQADGSFNSSGPRNHVRFNFTKQRKTDRLIKLLQNAGVTYTVSVEPARPQNTQIYVTLDHIPPKNFQWVLDDVANISGIWARDFVEEMSYWDACRRHSKRFKYDSTIVVNAEAVQLMATLAGYRTCWSTYVDSRKEQFSDVYTVHVTLTDCSNGQSVVKNEIDYTGMVYCVTVPTGMIVVRRNHRVSISGNSGEPSEVLPRILDILGDRFGHTRNAKGYKVLNPKVRVIQGDGIDANSLLPIMRSVLKAGWSMDNLAFGSGGGLLQKVNRDTQKFAFKCSAVKIDGQWREVLKDPVTDPGKKSKAGRLGLHNGKTVAYLGDTYSPGQLVTVYENGRTVTHYTLEDVRSRAAL